MSALTITNPPTHEKPLCILLIGAPGSGKTTLADQLSKTLGITHLDIPLLIINLLSQKEKYRALWEHIADGETIDEALAMEILDQIIHTEDIAFKGNFHSTL